jgi:hypothetical protein
MAYTITTTAGATLASIADGTVNSTATSLTLIGKNYAGYGIFLNENYIKLLENFTNSSAPNAPLTGQLWYDSTNALLKVYNGTIWKPISSSASGNTQPSSPVIGDLWYDSANAQLKVWSGSAFITVGPSYTTTSGTSGAVVETILDSGSASHVVVKFFISNTVVGILSKDATFTPQTSISGFTTIVPGFNLSSAIAGALFTGTVTNADTVDGINASQFLRSDQATSSSYAVTVGSLLVGSDLTVATSSGDVNLTNVTSNKDLNLFINKGGVSTKAIGITGTNGRVVLGNDLNVTGAANVTGTTTLGVTSITGAVTLAAQMLPSANISVELGSTSFRWANVWATTFRGTAITASYADLAERFEADSAYQPGTVVELGGDKEITAADQDLSDRVFGVISTRAGFLMNGEAGSDITHPPVAMQGRVPVRVIGRVKKGDRLVSAGNGLARAASRAEITAFNAVDGIIGYGQLKAQFKGIVYKKIVNKIKK